MNNKFTKLTVTSFAFILLLTLFSNSSKIFEGVKADSELKLVYNCKNDMNEYFEGVYDTNANSTYWAVEALNIIEFTSVSGQGTSLADANGVLPSASAFDNKFAAPALSIKTYPLFTNKTMYEAGSRYFNQFPTGWKMTANSNPKSVKTWPEDTGYCSADTTYLKYYLNGFLHPGNGAAIAIYFKAPYTGTITIKDSIGVSDSRSDGTYNCIYRVPSIETRNYMWNSVGTHALYGGYPIYPSEHVSPSSNWETGWLHINQASTENIEIKNFSINRGDYLVFIYASGPQNGYDTTTNNPIVTYDESSVNNWMLDQEKNLGIVKVEKYVDLNDYRSAEQNDITDIINTAVTNIDSCLTIEEIDTVVASSRVLLDQVKTDKQYISEELNGDKTIAINSLSTYVNQDDYRESEKATIQSILSEATELINKSLSKEEIDNHVELAKIQLSSIKTAAQLTNEELNNLKRTAMNEIESLVDLSSYDEIQKTAVEKAQESYKEKIYDATSTQEVEQYLNEGKAYIESIPKQNEANKTANTLTIIFAIIIGLALIALGILLYIFLKKRGVKNENN